MGYKNTGKMQFQQSQVLSKFMNSLKNNDLESFLSAISKEDKAYIIGAYNASLDENENVPFETFACEFLKETQSIFKEYIDSYGVSSSVRYYNEMEADLYLLKGVEGPITYIADSKNIVMKLNLVLETALSEDGKLLAEWKAKVLTTK